MVRAHEHRDQNGQTASDGAARALVGLLMLAAFLLAPFMATIAKPENAATSQVTQVVSSPSQATKRCPKKGVPGQPNACASSGVPAASLDGRGVTPPAVPQRSSIAPLYDLTLATQCCNAPPDRPPRFVA